MVIMGTQTFLGGRCVPSVLTKEASLQVLRCFGVSREETGGIVSSFIQGSLRRTLNNATLRTASGSGFGQRRYFDTPGYYFDVEAGKSFFTGGKLVKEIRLGADLGFMAWETTGSWQDDAPMYGAKLILANDHWKLDNTLAGYYGWMHTSDRYGSDYGDAPLVLATRLEHTMGSRSLFIQYQHGLNDFPYNQFRIGYSFTAPRLTPRYRSL